MDTIELPDKALTVPQLIIANGADNINGTMRPYGYFERQRKRSAPLTFVVQNGVPHCCAANMTPLVLIWLDDVFQQRAPVAANKSLAKIDEKRGWEGFIRSQKSEVKDTWKEPVWSVSDAWAERYGKPSPVASTQDAGWLPSKRFAQAWLAFQKQLQHSIIPLE
jgi:hypothetical protein